MFSQAVVSACWLLLFRALGVQFGSFIGCIALRSLVFIFCFKVLRFWWIQGC